jgi:EmrB/QacA subfamily drug resistance transporter
MHHRRLVPLIIATAFFMENTDSTVISTSLPVIAGDLGADPIALKLAITSYLVSLAVFIPISGWMADRFGSRNVFAAALAVFMAGSLACAAASSLGGFVLARFFQGMGGAMMIPVGRLVILRSVPKSEVVQALATLTIPALIGPIMGPPLGGFITTYFHWRWIFFINIPIGLLGIALALRYIPNIREEDTPPLDVVGFLLSGFGMALLMLGLATGGRHLMPIEASVASGLVGAALVLAYIPHMRRKAAPLLQLSLLGIPTFRASVLGGSLFRIGVGAIPFLLPLMLQVGFGLNPLQSGSITFVATVGALFTKAAAKSVLQRLGFRRVLVVNAVIGTAFIGAHGLFTAATPFWLMIAVLLLGGCFRSLQFTSINAIGYADVSSRDMSSATSISGVVQQLSLSIGVALGAFVVESAASWRGGGTDLIAADFGPAFFAVAAVSAFSTFVFMGLRPDAGAEMSGHEAVKRRAPATGLGDGVND